MIPWLVAAALLAAFTQEPLPVPIDLERYMDRAAALDGRWVEFEAYVILMRRPSNRHTLSALTGETRTLSDGTTVTLCADNPEASVAVLLGRNGLGPLSRRPRGRPMPMSACGSGVSCAVNPTVFASETSSMNGSARSTMRASSGSPVVAA